MTTIYLQTSKITLPEQKHAYNIIYYRSIFNRSTYLHYEKSSPQSNTNKLSNSIIDLLHTLLRINT